MTAVKRIMLLMSVCVFLSACDQFLNNLRKIGDNALSVPNRIQVISLKTEGTVKIVWSGVANATSYVVEITNSDYSYPGYMPEQIIVSTTYYTDTGTIHVNGSTVKCRVKAQNSGGESPWSIQVTGTRQQSVYSLGDHGPGGGIIVYTGGTGSWKYLEAAPASTQGNADWGLANISFQPTGESGDNKLIGAGLANTDQIVARLQTAGQSGKAAQKCRGLNINGCNDWFLPSRNEVDEMYKFRTACELYETRYWSSSTSNGTNAYFLNFNDNSWYTSLSSVTRPSVLAVRAMRRF